MSSLSVPAASSPADLRVTHHARARLRQRFPGREAEVLGCCEAAWRRLRAFIGDATYRHIHDDSIAVIAQGVLITVYPRTFGGRS